MAGHSHWKNIQHKKGAADAARGRVWSKLSRAIMVAAKNGGSDPVMNVKLRVAIDDAPPVSMPEENIERARQKGARELGGVSYDQINYEGVGARGAPIHGGH